MTTYSQACVAGDHTWCQAQCDHDTRSCECPCHDAPAPVAVPTLTDVVRAFTHGMAHVAVVARAQGAMAWTMRGDLEQARTALVAMPPEALAEVSAAAAALSSLADEVMSATPREDTPDAQR